MKHPFEKNLTDFYEYLLLGPLTSIYKARKTTELDGFLNYSNLIIDKFAIHSASFIHLSKGIIELKKSNETVKMTGYDLFTVNAVFRAIMENYATFNQLFVESKSFEEQKFRFLLWKIDGLFDKQKFDIKNTDFGDAEKILQDDKKILELTIGEFEKCKFYSDLKSEQLEKLYKLDKKRFNWRFIIENDKIIPLSISTLIKHTCRTRAFINNYRYTSIHSHTNYLALEHFEKTRGKPISNEYADPIIKLAIYLTSMLIYDIVNIDNNAKKEFEMLPNEIKSYVEGISLAIKRTKNST